MKCQSCGNENNKKMSRCGAGYICLVCGGEISDEKSITILTERKPIVPKFTYSYEDEINEMGMLELREKGLQIQSGDPDIAYKYLHKAALKGDKVSQYHLGLLLEKKAEKDKALFWLKQAAFNGYTEAKNYLRENFSDEVQELSFNDYGSMSDGIIMLCKAVSPYILTIYCCSPIRTNITSSGTGFVLTGGYVVTNNHVITYDDNKVFSQIIGQLGLDEGKSVYHLDVVSRDANNDIAILKFDAHPENLVDKGLILGNSDQCVMGEKIITIGNGLNFGLALSTGYISQPSKHIEEEGYDKFKELLQLNMDINHGNSGGPVINEKKEVVGITTMVPTERVCFVDKNKNISEGKQSVYGITFASTSNSIKKLIKL